MAEPLRRETILETPDEGAAGLSPALQRLRSALPEAFRSRVRSARELDRELRDAAGEGAFATGVPVLDRLLDGGLPRGELVELVGARTSGRFSTLLATLAAATSVGEAAALIDLGDSLEPESLAGLGADLERLLWLRPLRLKDALAAAEMLLDGGFPLVALDLGYPPVRGGRGAEAAWLRLARAARAHDAALLVGAPYRVTGTAAGVVLQAERARPSWSGERGSPRLLAGVASRLVLEKRRGQLPGRGEGMSLTAPGVPQPAAPAAPIVPVAPVAPMGPRVRPAAASAPTLTLLRRAAG